LEISNLFENITSQLAVFFTAMTPIGEIRAAIPLGLGVYKLNLYSVFIIAVIGNLIAAVIILYILEPLSKFLMRKFKPANRFFTWLFNRTRRKYSKKFEKYSGFALAVFVGIPLPMTGAWTGALIAFVFGISPKKAILDILMGIIMAGIIVTVIFKTIGYVKFITVG
jgi:uncharacterized membrane protein